MSGNIASFIDHTILKPEATGEDVRRLCREAAEYGFFAVCVNPSHVETAAGELESFPVKVCTVIGFPLGATTTAVKAFETAEAVKSGAGEIDMVLHIGALKSGDKDYVLKDIKAVVGAACSCPVKVIIETGLLNDQEKVLACKLAVQAGALFLKTSTGFGPGGATVEDVKLIRATVGPVIGVKASGGIKNAVDALRMIDAGATRIGTSSGVAIVSGQALT